MRFFRLPLLTRFRRDERGVVTAELILSMLWLCWWYVASFAIFDGYRQYNANIKATYTLGDLISRQSQVGPDFLDGLSDMYDFLINWRAPSEVRYTSLYWDESDDQYEVDWSHTTGTWAALTTADLADLEDKLPNLVDGEYVILVESRSMFQSAFNVGPTNGLVFNNFVVTSPRFAANVVYNGSV